MQLSELEGETLTREELVEEFQDDALDAYGAKEEELGPELMRELERFLVLQVVDVRWREHLDAMEYVREGIHLRAMAQKDPLAEYRAEGHRLFQELSAAIREEVLRLLFHAEIAPEEAGELQEATASDGRGNGSLVYEHESLSGAEAIQAATASPSAAAAVGAVTPAAAAATPAAAKPPQQRVAAEHEKIGRNDPCWCGSGKKFKKCHGA
ncbi:MAG: SEC-C metal-binding domain-containing protein [Actinomycetota bacterium]|nr:SEC-C metal-binding domain-containing protein [Actinomycetota bacterium]